ncbi:MAG TPA: hypothetical protein VFH80_07020 [Solirubrobacteraceae bacterium]|nr:hypothetical protein [Solirubrobacteraceae bacterium]
MALDAQWSAVARGYRFALILAAVVGVAAVVASTAAGHWLAGVFICVGLGLGGWNSRKLWMDTQLLTNGSAEAGDRVRGPALAASAKRLGLITILAFLIALAYRPLGWTVFLGLVVFQVVMVVAVLPPLKRIVRPTTPTVPGVHT